MQVSMLLVVKLPGRPLAAASGTGLSHQGRLFYVRDCSSSLRFLVDTGAEVSVVPPSRAERPTSPGSFVFKPSTAQTSRPLGYAPSHSTSACAAHFDGCLSSLTYRSLSSAPISCTILVCSSTFDTVRSLTPRHTCGSTASCVRISPHPRDSHAPSRMTLIPFLSYWPSFRP